MRDLAMTIDQFVHDHPCDSNGSLVFDALGEREGIVVLDCARGDIGTAVNMLARCEHAVVTFLGCDEGAHRYVIGMTFTVGEFPLPSHYCYSDGHLRPTADSL